MSSNMTVTSSKWLISPTTTLTIRTGGKYVDKDITINLPTATFTSSAGKVIASTSGYVAKNTQMGSAVSGTITITAQTGTNVTNYATANVASATVSYSGGDLRLDVPDISVGGTELTTVSIPTRDFKGLEVPLAINLTGRVNAVTYTGKAGWITASATPITAISSTPVSNILVTDIFITDVTLPNNKTLYLHDSIGDWTWSADANGNITIT